MFEDGLEEAVELKRIIEIFKDVPTDRLRELAAAERDGRVRFVKDDDDRCLNCVSYLGVCECTAIGYCGGTNFYCNWFERKPKAAEAALAGKGE